MSDPAVHRLFWTGGWDSTFRLLDLVLVQRREVQPYYLIDTQLRRSSSVEMRTMEALRGDLPDGLIAPTIFRHVEDIAENPPITEKLDRLREHGHLARQYEWLARFVEEEGLEGLEVGICRGGGGASRRLAHHLEPAGDAYVLRADADPDLSIFRSFRFPLFAISKLDMQAAAERHGFRDLLERSWFCVTPTARGLPCGMCRPCRYARAAGMARRIRPSGHVRYHRKRLTDWLKQTPPARVRRVFARRLRSGQRRTQG